MTDITIPPEAREAAGKEAYNRWVAFCIKCGGVPEEYLVWFDLSETDREQWCADAEATCLAMLKAWPGAERIYRSEDEKLFTIILSLPQENTND